MIRRQADLISVTNSERNLVAVLPYSSSIEAAEVFAARPLACSFSTTMTKYILVSGGVVSGIGKGVIGMGQHNTAQGIAFN